jgi:rsbT co-antagonist protein RsbR
MFQTLTHKVALLASVAAILFLIIATVIITNILALQAIGNHVTQVTLVKVELSGQINTDLFRGFAEALSYARTRTADNRESALREMEDAAALTAQLQTLNTNTAAYDDLTDAFAALQVRRVEVIGLIRPAVTALVQAVDRSDEPAIMAALDQLNTHKSEIEQLEEATGDLLDRAIPSADQASAQAAQMALISAALSFGLVLLCIPLVFTFIRRTVVRPITSLESAATAVADGCVDQVVAVTSADELGRLQQAFNQMVASLARGRAQIDEQQRLLEKRVAERTADLQRTLADLQQATDERTQLQETVRELASPVVPVMDGIVVMPLIGVIDSARAAGLTHTLLTAIEQHRATTVIMDVTGVPIIDTQVAQVLLQTAAASRLIGARTILVGMRPELAQTIVGLGLDLSQLITRADLQSGVRYAMGPAVGVPAVGAAQSKPRR